MRVTTLALAALAASPAAALSVSTSACNGLSAELVTDASGPRLALDGAPVPLDPDAPAGAAWTDLACLSRDGDTVFALLRRDPDGAEAYYLLDPATRALAPVPEDEARALGLFEDEDDWGLGLLDD